MTTVLAHDGDLQVRLRAQCATAEAAIALSEEVAELAAEALGDHVYSRNDEPLEAVIGRRLAGGRRDAGGGGERDGRRLGRSESPVLPGVRRIFWAAMSPTRSA